MFNCISRSSETLKVKVEFCIGRIQRPTFADSTNISRGIWKQCNFCQFVATMVIVWTISCWVLCGKILTHYDINVNIYFLNLLVILGFGWQCSWLWHGKEPVTWWHEAPFLHRHFWRHSSPHLNESSNDIGQDYYQIRVVSIYVDCDDFSNDADLIRLIRFNTI